MATFQQVIDAARPTLNDSEKVRYTDAECLAYAIDGMREAALVRPDLFTTIGTITCVSGVEQTIPATGWFLVDVFGIHNGDAIYEGDFKVFRVFEPGWRTDDPGPAEFWMRFPTDPKQQPNNRFYVSPPALPGQVLDACWVEVNATTWVLATTVPLTDPYLPALEAYVIYRCETKDDEFVNTNRAALFRTAFNGMLAAGQASEQVAT